MPDTSISYRVHCQLLSSPTTHSYYPRDLLDDYRVELIIMIVLLQHTFRVLKINKAARSGLSGAAHSVAKPKQSEDQRISRVQYAQQPELFQTWGFTWGRASNTEKGCDRLWSSWPHMSIEDILFLSKVWLQFSGFRKLLAGNKRLPKNLCFAASSLESLSVALPATLS